MLTSDSTEVRAFVAACQENRNLAVSGPSGYRLVVIERRKYLAVDEIPTFEGSDCAGQSGRFLIDRETHVVYAIRGYGQRGNRVGMLDTLTAQFCEASATFDVNAGAHVERGYARVASTTPARPRLYVVKS